MSFIIIIAKMMSTTSSVVLILYLAPVGHVMYETLAAQAFKPENIHAMLLIESQNIQCFHLGVQNMVGYLITSLNHLDLPM